MDSNVQTQESLERRLKELDAEIAEAKKRLPAHSVKPQVMAMLLDLEDEYEAVRQQLIASKDTGHKTEQ